MMRDWDSGMPLEGEPCLGKSRDGSGNPDVLIRLSGKQHFLVNQFFKKACVGTDNPYDVRDAVLLWEAFRTQVVCELPSLPEESKRAIDDFLKDVEVVGAKHV